MARGLGDVLHHIDPQLGGASRPSPAREPRTGAAFGVPVADDDVLRAGALWNLAVELARLGAPARLLAPAATEGATPWPESGAGPLGAEFARLTSDAPEAVARRARASAAGAAGPVLACLAPVGFERGFALDGLERALLLVPCQRAALREAEGRARRILEVSPAAEVGVTLLGARGVAEAGDAFLDLAGCVERATGRGLVSYGLLVDDLALYRSVAERRPVGLVRPQSSAARALADVARLLLDLPEDPPP